MVTSLSNIQKASLFYGIAMTLSLAVVLFFRAAAPRAEIVVLVNMLTPLLATAFMLFVITRDGYVREGRSSLGLGRSGWKRWGFALLLPLLVLTVSYGLGWISGITELVVPEEENWLLRLIAELPLTLIFTILFVLSEEIGFRGYLLPRLLEWGQARAAVVAGFLHGTWHLPLILLTPFYLPDGERFLTIPLFLLLLTAAGAIYGSLRLTTDSIWPPVILHAAFNTLLSIFSRLTLFASPLAVYLVGESGVLTLLSTAAVAYWLLQPREIISEQMDWLDSTISTDHF